MQGTHAAVFRQIQQWLQKRADVWLCTVIRTYGSAPRPIGSLMAFSAGHGVIGSVSGGCIEEALFNDLANGALLKRTQRSNGPWRIRYGQNQEEQQRFSLPCGGQLHLLLEHIEPGQEAENHFATLTASLQQRLPLTRCVNLTDGQFSLNRGNTVDDRGGVRFNDQTFLHTLTAGDQLLLVGLGEVSRYVAQFASAVDFAVTLCDMREDFIQLYPVSDLPVIHALPDRLIAERFHDSHTAIMTLSHDPRLDDLALMEALQTQAFFIGAMGSEHTSAARRKRLASVGISAGQLQRLHAPIGIPIASKTPPEIALSAVTQLTGIRNRLRRSEFSGRLAGGYDDVCQAEAIR